MKNVRVVLTIEHRLQAQLVKQALASYGGYEVVGESTDTVQVMALISQKEPDAWIHSWAEGPELQATLSHLYALHPELTVVRISPDESAGYVQVQIRSLAKLANLLNSAISDRNFEPVS